MRISYLFILLFTTVGLWAQNGKNGQANQMHPETNKAITSTVEELIKGLNGLYTNNTERSIAPVVSLLEPDYEMTSFVIDVGGNPRRRHLTLNDYKNQLNQLIGLSDFSIHYSLEKVNIVAAIENFATVTFVCNIEYSFKGEASIKGKVLNTLYLRKSNGAWKIWEASTANVVKEQTVGICPCEYIKIGEGETNYTANLLIPNGVDFAHTQIHFEVAAVGDIKMIKASNNTYAWQNGKVSCVKKGEESVAEAIDGPATSVYEAMNLILVKHIYKAQCLGLRAQIKK